MFYWYLQSSTLSIPDHAKVFLDKVLLALFSAVFCAREHSLQSIGLETLALTTHSPNNEKQIFEAI